MEEVMAELHRLNEQVSMHYALLYEVIENRREFTEGFFSLKLLRDMEAQFARSLEETRNSPLVALSYGVEVQVQLIAAIQQQIERIGG